MPTSPIPFLRAIGLVEAVSFLILLAVAMPLKYFAGMPLAVKIVGWIHGALFVVFMIALVRATVAAKWPVARAAMIFVAALVPLGPFVIDRRMKQYEAEWTARDSASPGA